MDMGDIGAACLMVYDELKDDAESADLIEKIDTAEGDDAIKVSIHAPAKGATGNRV